MPSQRTKRSRPPLSAERPTGIRHRAALAGAVDAGGSVRVDLTTDPNRDAPTVADRDGVTGTPSPTANACVAPSNEPQPHGTIAANFATALAFAPDGRLFWTERSGTVRVWQNGASRVFARVRTVTTEPSGGYSERGLLGLAISPTFATDRFVYAFYSDAELPDPARDPLERLRRHRHAPDDHRHASRRETTAATRADASPSDPTASST